MLCDIAAFEVLPRRTSLWSFKQVTMEQRLGPCHDLINDRFSSRTWAALWACRGSPRGIPAFSASILNASPKPVLHVAGQAENISSDVADPAFPGLAIGIDLQTWVRVVMPWADGRKPRPSRRRSRYPLIRSTMSVASDAFLASNSIIGTVIFLVESQSQSQMSVAKVVFARAFQQNGRKFLPVPEAYRGR